MPQTDVLVNIIARWIQEGTPFSKQMQEVQKRATGAQRPINQMSHGVDRFNAKMADARKNMVGVHTNVARIRDTLVTSRTPMTRLGDAVVPMEHAIEKAAVGMKRTPALISAMDKEMNRYKTTVDVTRKNMNQFRFEFLGIMFAGMALARGQQKWLTDAMAAYREIRGEYDPLIQKIDRITEKQKKLKAELIEGNKWVHEWNESFTDFLAGLPKPMKDTIGLLRMVALGIGKTLMNVGQLALAYFSLKIAMARYTTSVHSATVATLGLDAAHKKLTGTMITGGAATTAGAGMRGVQTTLASVGIGAGTTAALTGKLSLALKALGVAFTKIILPISAAFIALEGFYRLVRGRELVIPTALRPFLQWLDDLSNAIWDTLGVKARKQMRRAGEGMAGELADYLKPGSPPKKGPLRNMDMWGKDYSAMIAEGMIRGRNFIADAAGVISQTVLSGIGGAFDFLSMIRSVFQAPIDVLAAATSFAEDLFGEETADLMREKFEVILTELIEDAEELATIALSFVEHASNTIKKVIDKIPKFFGVTLKFFEDTFETISSVIAMVPEVADVLLRFFEHTIDTAKSAISKVVPKFVEISLAFFESTTNTVANVLNTFPKIINIILSFTEDTLKTVSSILRLIPEGLTILLGFGKDAVYTASRILNQIPHFVNITLRFYESAYETISAIIALIPKSATIILSFIEDMLKSASDLVKSAVSAASNFASVAISFTEKAGNTAIDLANTAANAIIEVFKQKGLFGAIFGTGGNYTVSGSVTLAGIPWVHVSGMSSLGGKVDNVADQVSGEVSYQGGRIVAALSGIGSFQTGGYIPKTGLYMLHAGEYVNPVRTPTGGGGFSGTIHVEVNMSPTISSSMDLDRVAREVGDRIARDIERRVGVF